MKNSTRIRHGLAVYLYYSVRNEPTSHYKKSKIFRKIFGLSKDEDCRERMEGERTVYDYKGFIPMYKYSGRNKYETILQRAGHTCRNNLIKARCQ